MVNTEREDDVKKKKNNPLVSVLMTAYNREKYIGYAIDSVLSSSYENFELIIVDDRSDDRTVEVANRYALNDNRIKVFVNEKNLGDYPNRNRAASYAKGVFLKYVDSDDAIYPWGLEILVGMMEMFPDAGWGLCSLSQDISRPFPFALNPREAYEYNYLGPGLFHKAPLSSIIRNSVFTSAGGFLPQRMVSDRELWHRLALLYKVVLMPEGMVWSREHNEQEFKSKLKFSREYENITVRYLNSNECPLDRKDLNYILRAKRRKLFLEFVKSCIKLNPALVKSCWSAWRAYI